MDPSIAVRVLDITLPLVQEFDAFRDNPWALIYEVLDRSFPGSLFIHTIREPNEWINSVVGRFGEQSTPMREWIYGIGSPKGNETIYLERYRRHNQEVSKYFENQCHRYLRLDLPMEEDTWRKLCPFLDVPDPGIPFPRLNQRTPHLDVDR